MPWITRVVGCVELSPQGNCLGWSDAAMFNLVKALELALNNGKCLLTGEQLGPDLGSLEDYDTFEKLEESFKGQVDHFMERMIRLCDYVDRMHASVLPSPFLSLVVNDCIEKGRDVTEGGAKYNFSGIQAIQPANLADCLAALKLLVYEERRVDRAELLAALRNDFKGDEPLRQTLLNRAPKYGNDIEWVDQLGLQWISYFKERLSRSTNARGGAYHIGLYTVSAHVPLGMNVGATPDGRHARAPLADGGISAVYGRDTRGPTALLKSVARMSAVQAGNGTLLNMKFQPDFFKEESRGTFVQLLKGFVRLKIHHAQFNVVRKEDLEAARRDRSPGAALPFALPDTPPTLPIWHPICRMKSLPGRRMGTSENMKGMVFDIRRFSIHDGPGIRTAVFLKGCPLRCAWCQNPEGIESAPWLTWFPNKCISCLSCVPSCPRQAISPGAEGGIQVDRALCDSCGACAEACPARALVIIGGSISADDVVKEIMTDELFYDISGGGATLTGGEPMAQADFSLEVLALLKERKVHTAIETSLLADPDSLSRVRERVDLFIVDLKLDESARHAAATGVSNDLIKSNFIFLSQAGADILVRIPLIPGFTADADNLRKIGELVARTRADIPVELINFNPLARDKYGLLDRSYPFDRSTGKYTTQQMTGFEAILAATGVRIQRRAPAAERAARK